MQFEFPAELDPVFIAGQPEESYTNIAMSLLLPYLEPYLIRSMKAAKAHVTDARIAADLERFCAQEGQHYLQHSRFNALFRDRGFPGLQPLEEELDADYRRFTRSKSLRFNLAYAEGFEALTSAMARVQIGQDLSHWHPAAADLWMWHLLEELEHRTVAFDVYEHVCGNYAYRCGVGVIAQSHLMRFVFRARNVMLAADPRTETEFRGAAGKKEREKALYDRLRRELLPLALKTYSRGYTPHDIEMPPKMLAWADKFNAAALSTA